MEGTGPGKRRPKCVIKLGKKGGEKKAESRGVGETGRKK